MVERVEALVLTMSADLTRMEKAYQRAQKQTDATTRAIERRFDQMNDRVVRSGEDMGDGLNRAIASIGIGYAVRELGQYADAWTNLRNTVRQYESVLGPVDTASRELVAISNDAGVAIDALGTVFGGASRAATKFGYEGEQVFQFMEAVSKGAAIANNGVSAVSGAMVQLSQSLGSPKVQLGEFNSLIEGTPRLAQAFADGIGKANGDLSRLRELIASGDISGQELFTGLLSQLGKIRSEFAGVDTTIGRAITTLQNSAIEYVGSVDQSLGVSQKLAGLITQVSNNLDLLASAAIAAAVVIGGPGLVKQLGAAGNKFAEVAKAFNDQRSALTSSVASLRKLAVEQARVAESAAFMLKLQQDVRRDALATVQSNATLSAAYLRQEQALRAQVFAREALNDANNKAGSGEGPRMLALREVELATRKLQQTELELAAVRRAAPPEVRALYAANTELSKTQIAAANASRNLAETQGALSVATKASSESALLVKSAWAGLTTFLSGPFGTILTIAALTLAFQALGSEAPKAAEKVDEARQLLDKAAAARSSIETDTARIKTINEGLTEAILAQGEAAQTTAALEIAAITERIAKNKELEQVYKSRAAADLASARRRRDSEREQQGRILAQIAGRAPLGDVRQLGSLGTGGLIDAATREAERASLASERISRDQQRLLEIVADQRELDAEIRSLEDIVAGRGQGEASPTSPVTSADGAGAGRSSLNRYQTDLERLNETLAEIGKAKDSDANKSRAALQAMLDYGKAVGDMDAAVEAWLANGGLLTDADVKILEAEVDGARELYTTLVDIQALDIEIPVEVDQTDLDEFLRQAEETAVKIGAVDTPEIIQLKEDIGEAVKDGFRQGLQDDNWGEALRGLLASAMTSALDDTLTEVGNWLGDLIVQLGQASVDSGFWTSLANGVGSFFGGGRAAGGPVSAGGAYRVNESGKGEFLFMGNNAGQVLTAAQINGLTAGGGRGSGGLVINAGLTVQGSIDAASWPMVQQAMAAQERRIAQQVPGMIDKRVIDGKRNRQGGYR